MFEQWRENKERKKKDDTYLKALIEYIRSANISSSDIGRELNPNMSQSTIYIWKNDKIIFSQSGDNSIFYVCPEILEKKGVYKLEENKKILTNRYKRAFDFEEKLRSLLLADYRNELEAMLASLNSNMITDDGQVKIEESINNVLIYIVDKALKETDDGSVIGNSLSVKEKEEKETAILDTIKSLESQIITKDIDR